MAVTPPARPLGVCLLMDTLPVGGAENVLLRLLAGLDRTAFRPGVLCLRDAGPMADRFRAAGVPVEVLPRGRGGGMDPRIAVRLARRLRERREDVVLMTQHRAPLLFGRIAAQIDGIPNVVAVHDMGGRSIGVRSLPRWTVETMRATSALVLLAPAQQRYLEQEEGLGGRPWRRTRTVTIGNGIELGAAPTAEDEAAGRALLGLAPEHVVVGMVAALRPDKAHDVLLRAVARLAPGHPELRLAVIGGGETEPRLRALAAELGIGDRVVFTGVRDDVRRLLPGLDVKCLASYPVKETYPMSVLEAMAAARPVVVTECGALADIVEEGVEGFRVPVGDDATLADRLGRLVGDPALRARMGGAGRERAEREFGIDRAVGAYQDLFRALAARRARSRRPRRRTRRT